MTGYIISPAWFYWISVADALIGICILGMILMGIVTTILIFFYSTESWDDEDHRKLKRHCIISGSIAVICLLGFIFIPDKKTLIQMQLAKMATYENAEHLMESITNYAELIISTIMSMK